MTVREVLGADGTPLVYRAFGPADAPPLVLLHGWAQSSRCWGDGVLDALARNVPGDRRRPARPRLLRGTREPATTIREGWAGDVDAVFAAEGVSQRNPAVLLGWSYGGLVICDYLAAHGTAAVDAVMLVGAITSLGRGEKGGAVGPSMRAAIPGAMSEDPRDRESSALGRFGNALTGRGRRRGSRVAGPVRRESVHPAAGARRAVRPDREQRRPAVGPRRAGACAPRHRRLGGRRLGGAHHVASLVPRVTTSIWEDVGHGPFVEDPDRFVDEVARFATVRDRGSARRGADRFSCTRSLLASIWRRAVWRGDLPAAAVRTAWP